MPKQRYTLTEIEQMWRMFDEDEEYQKEHEKLRDIYVRAVCALRKRYQKKYIEIIRSERS